ncbi:MAG: hypothetical protein ABJC89_07955, partial [Acidobacteriota bacterium]
MPRAVAIAGVVLALATARVHAGDGAPDSSENAVLAIQTWVTAVNTHIPGRADASAAKVAALSFQARSDLNAGMGLFLA